jgi:hypothetical protein
VLGYKFIYLIIIENRTQMPHLKIITDFYSKMDGKEKRVVKGNPIVMFFSEILLPV